MSKGQRTAEVSRRLVDVYVTSLRQRLPTYCIRQLDKLPKAQEHQLTRLRQAYPGTPAEILYLLQRVNGTCWEMLKAPPGSVPPSATATTTATSVKDGDGVPATVGATLATGSPPSVPASATTATEESPAMRTKAMEISSSPPGNSAKSVNKVTAATAAAMASEAAAFIKAQIAKKVTTIGAPRQRRPLPHFVALPILGSTYRCCPYYLKSVDQMLAAEQLFPPPPATLPDQGEGWVPPPTTAATQTSLSSPAPAGSSLATDAAPAGAGSGDGVGVVAQGGCDGCSASAVNGSPPSTASGAALNTNCIASVYAGCRIVYGAPPPSSLPASPLAASSASSTAALGATDVGDASASFTKKPMPASSGEESRVVYVDPRIDIHASFYQWLAFADSVQPHVRGSTPTIPDADPAKVTAAAAAGNTADGGRVSPTCAPSPTCTPPRPPKQFAASRLYIDFKPVELHGGVYGQVIQFVHGRPDSFSVVANDFGGYLKYIMAEEYSFTEELETGDADDGDDSNGNAGGGVREGCRTDLPSKGQIPSIITTADGRPLTSPNPSQADVPRKR